MVDIMDIEDEDGEDIEIVEDTGDGTTEIDVSDVWEVTAEEAREHFEDIKDAVDPSMLRKAVSRLASLVEDDKESWEPRRDITARGLELTGIAGPAPRGASFNGASRVTHPLVAQIAIDFSSRVMKEIFPPNGPVRAKILGEQDHQKIKKAQRKTEFMNWQLTEQAQECREELEQTTTQTSISGLHHVKAYWCVARDRIFIENIPDEFVYTPASASSFTSALRKTHAIFITEEEFKEKYGDIDIPDADDLDESRAQALIDKMLGKGDDSTNIDNLKELWEIHASFDVGEGNLPYVLTIDSSTYKVLSLVKNWMPDDDTHQKLEWFVPFSFLQWQGAKPIGLTQLIGDLSEAATGALRALMDSAQIQNMPTLMKLKGAIDGQDIVLEPGAITTVDGNLMDGDIRKLIMAMPFNPPSPILFQLLEYLVDNSKNVVRAVADNLADNNPNAPVGTTLALIEQGAVVFSEIHHRMHNSMSKLLKIVHRLNKCYLTEEYIERLNTGLDIKPEDFDGEMDVIPVSDPNIFSEAQRFAQTQAIVQRSAAVPGLYDQRAVEKLLLEQMKIAPEMVLMPEPGSENLDPASENVSLAMGRPVSVLPKQAHLAHLRVHIAYIQSQILMNEETKQRALYPLAMHLLEHIQQYYLTETHEAVDKVMDFDDAVKDDENEQATIILSAQAKIEEGLAPVMPIIMQIVQEAQKYKPQPQQQDPAIAIETMRGQQRMQLEQMKVQADMQSKQMQLQADQQAQMAKQQHDLQLEAMRQQGESQRKAQELAVRVQTNDSDNNTAVALAAAEIQTGQNFPVSTGTGINPGV